jgi:hypothetical protein
MSEYFDLGANVFSMVNAFRDLTNFESRGKLKSDSCLCRKHHLSHVDPNLYEVRHSICVAGVNHETVIGVKNLIADLIVEPFDSALESFHVKRRDDVRDGALLVPKVVLAAGHCPGLKLLDESGTDRGQLDFLYDEVCNVGAEVLIIYIDLPRAIYQPNKSFAYHQRIAELLFPNQPVLEALAIDNSLITVTENTGLNHIQRNIIREWMTKPIGADHRIYRAAADYLSEAESQLGEAAASYWSETELHAGGIPRGLTTGWTSLVSVATEEHRTASDNDNGGGSRKIRKKRKRSSYGSVLNRTRDVTANRRSELKPLLESLVQYDSQELLLLNDANGVDFRSADETDCL